MLSNASASKRGISEKSLLETAVRSSLTLSCAYYAISDWRAGHRLARNNFETSSGTHAEKTPEEVVEYGTSVWNNYKRLADLGDFTGRIAEIGPGDNDVVAWQLLAHGASEVYLVDRFAPNRHKTRDKAIRAIARQMPALAPLLQGEADPPGLFRNISRGAKEYFAESPSSFDAILSCAVLEHVDDPIGALDSMALALRPGGVMVHFVDLRDHMMFPHYPPLAFLTLPDAVWRRMTVNSGRPNRVVFSRYKDWAEKSGLDHDFKITLAVGSDENFLLDDVQDAPENIRAKALNEVAKVRGKLAASLRHETDNDLMVAAFCLVLRKPLVHAGTGASVPDLALEGVI